MKVPRPVEQLLQVRDDELRAVAWGVVFHFAIFASYYAIRPLRDTFGVEGGVRNLPFLFLATLVVTLVIQPPYAAVVSRMPRRVFVPLLFEFVAVNLLLFLAALVAYPGGSVWIGRAFYVWLSVVNLFMISLYWATMADLFRAESAKRLFPLLAVGGTLGAIIGSSLAATLPNVMNPRLLLLVAVLGLQVVVLAAIRVTPAAHSTRADTAIGGGSLDGFREVVRSPFLLGICGFMLLYTVTSTFLYFQKTSIVEQVLTDRAVRTLFFARVDLAVNVLTLIAQIFVTGRVLRTFGVVVGLAALPVVTLLGFVGVGLVPTLMAVAVFEVARKAFNYGMSRPSREVLYTAVSREERFKAKQLIDTFVYRAGDQVGAWTSGLVIWAGFGVVGLAVAAAPVAALWIALAVWLGRSFHRLETVDADPSD
jgi:AAA family ATP:ADP antiporter